MQTGRDESREDASFKVRLKKNGEFTNELSSSSQVSQQCKREEN